MTDERYTDRFCDAVPDDCRVFCAYPLRAQRGDKIYTCGFGRMAFQEWIQQETAKSRKSRFWNALKSKSERIWEAIR